jgi:carboxyl-terminal processing protease
MGREGVTSVILDVRGNPGGLMTAAVEVAGLFLPNETLVVYTVGKEGGREREYRTQARPHRLEPELVVLVNGGSASAAEIAAGALQDEGRATLVGSTTFGKASVQSVVPMPDGSALKLTTATYYTPSGREIHENGIVPDVQVPFSIGRWVQSDWDDVSWKTDPQIVRAVKVVTGQSAQEQDEHSGD